MRKHRDIKLATNEARRNNFVLYKKNFSENLLALEIKKKQIFTNKQVYMSLSILEISNIVLYEIWYDYAKPKYGVNAKLSYMEPDSFIVFITTEDI